MVPAKPSEATSDRSEGNSRNGPKARRRNKESGVRGLGGSDSQEGGRRLRQVDWSQTAAEGAGLADSGPGQRPWSLARPRQVTPVPREPGWGQASALSIDCVNVVIR